MAKPRAPTAARKSSQPKSQSKKGPSNAPQKTPPWVSIPPDKLETFDKTVEERLGYKPRDFQMRGIRGQLLRRDVLVHAGTGRGKTVIAAGPHYHAAAAGRLTIMLSPLIALQAEQVETFEKEFKLKAMAVNSSSGGFTSEVKKALKKGEYQILLISPELLLSPDFVDEMLRDKVFTSRVMSVVVDEAHVVSHWGAGFRKKYGELGMLRAFLPQGTPFVAMSATLGPRVLKDVLQKLEFGKEDSYEFILEGNDRSNVALVARGMCHPLNSYKDLRFVIPDRVAKAEDIPLTMIYADNVPKSTDIIDYLEGLLPLALRGKGLIRPFNAVLTHDYRGKAMDAFKGGEIRVLVCTDAAGMGCNLPAVDVVVQYRLPASLSTFVQRAGRAARSAGREGLAVLLVEKSAYSIEEVTTKKKRTKKEISAILSLNGYLRGSYGGQNDNIAGERTEREPNGYDDDEGLRAFVLTKRCRRVVIARVYGNKEIGELTRCCDLCHPKLFDLTRPDAPVKKPAAKIKLSRFDDPVPAVVIALKRWRKVVYERDFANSMFGYSAVLSNDLIAKLALVKSIERREVLSFVLKPLWLTYTAYEDQIIEALENIPEDERTPVSPPQSQRPTAGSKRKADEGQEQEARSSVPAASNAQSTTTAPASVPPPPPSTTQPLHPSQPPAYRAANNGVRPSNDATNTQMPAHRTQVPMTLPQQQQAFASQPHPYAQGYYYTPQHTYYYPAYNSYYYPYPTLPSPSQTNPQPPPSQTNPQPPPHPFYPYQQHATSLDASTPLAATPSRPRYPGPHQPAASMTMPQGQLSTPPAPSPPYPPTPNQGPNSEVG